MRFSEETRRITLDVREFVTTARRGMPGIVSFDEEEPVLSPASLRALRECLPEAAPQNLAWDFSFDGFDYTLTGRAQDLTGGRLTTLTEVAKNPDRLTKNELAELRGEAFLLAFLAGKRDGKCPDSLTMIVCSSQNAEHCEITEKVTEKKLTAFFEKCIALNSLFATPEIERVTGRLPSMKALKFPYGKMREGQADFVKEAYRTFCRGGTLFASAPTGTGKTVSALFPAIRAMGEGKCDKVFYFTPKTTTAKAAEECLFRMCEKGANLRACLLSAKERICRRDIICRQGKELCPLAQNSRISEAALALYDASLPVAGEKEYLEYSEKFAVCPHELALTYAELCDVVIGDLNYLFDPYVYIRRFFSSKHRFCFLIDEAHNLPDRARDMYSAELDEAFLLSPKNCELLGALSDTKAAAEALKNEFHDILFPYLKDELRTDKSGALYGAAHLSSVPTELYTLFDDIIALTEEEIKHNLLAKDEEKSGRLHFLRTYLFTLERFRDTMAQFDAGYRLFLFYENGNLRAKLFCLDPAQRIAERLALGESALFFSGTLSPLDYYKATLGGDRTAGTLTVGSPFDKEHLAVAVMDKISTRFSTREETLLAVCRTVAATASAKRGNYMVFSPSFAYSEALAKAFRLKYPKIKVVEQKPNMSAKEKKELLGAFSENIGKDGKSSYLIGFCVMGGIYSEGIDLAGDRLIGAVIVGIGLPSLSYEREAIAEYYDEKYEMGKAFAYLYPGMNRVYQAAGRVIRTEEDRGAVVLIDDRFDDPLYRKTAPDLFSGMKFLQDPKELKEMLDRFWNPDETTGLKTDPAEKNNR